MSSLGQQENGDLMEEGSSGSDASPIFIVGVPRSGTTLLRMVLDAHPDVMCGPEAPWITGRGMKRSPNFWDLTTFLISNKWGPVSGLTGIDEGVIYRKMAHVVDGIMSTAARRKGKIRWAEKTPQHLLALGYLHSLFPRAKFVYIVRDGRDVALSTCKGSWKRLGFERKRVRNTYRNALRRWVAWNDVFLRDVAALKIEYISLRYEELVAHPQDELKRLCQFLDLPWNESILRPHNTAHDVVDPKGDGIASFNAHQGIDSTSVGRWRLELTWLQRQWTLRVGEAMLQQLGYPPTAKRA